MVDTGTEARIAAGTRIDRYTVESMIGRGGMAVVYRVRHQDLDSSYALKVLTIGGPSVRQRLLREGRVQASLRHPNIVGVTDVVDVDGAPGLVMEYVRGPSLERLLAAHRLTEQQADWLAQGIVTGVGWAHRHGLIHRDLKPGNILLAVTEAGLLPKVADFGLAKVVSGPAAGTGGTHSGATLGTPAYMAPEQIRNSKHVDARADVFSLGAVLYEMVCGVRAFDGDDVVEVFNAVSSGLYLPPRQRVSTLPERMATAIEGALQVDPDARVPDCETLLALWTGRSAGRRVWSSSLIERLAADPRGPDLAHEGAVSTWEDDRPVDPTLEIAPPRRRRRGVAWVWRPLAAILAMAGLALIAASVFAGWLFTRTGPWVEAEPSPEPVSIDQAAPRPAPPEAGPEEAIPAAVPVPSPPIREVARPAPVAAPEPAPEPAPVQPEPVPEPAAEPDAVPPGFARVTVQGDARRVYLHSEAGILEPGDVPPGDYQVHLFLEDGTSRPVLPITLAAGEHRVISCNTRARLCE